MTEASNLKINYLDMTRIEIANIILVARSDLSLHQTMKAAKCVDDSIKKQLPSSKPKERVKLSRELAEYLGDPHSYRTAIIMRTFYTLMEREKPPHPDDEGEGGLETSRPYIKNYLVR
jgi:hypothetical protein